MQSDPFDQLKSSLDTPRDYAFLAKYVRELELRRHEEEIFRRLAFENVQYGGAYAGSGTFIVSVVSELYEPLDAERKAETRRWWHDKVRQEANKFEDLKGQLTRLKSK